MFMTLKPTNKTESQNFVDPRFNKTLALVLNLGFKNLVKLNRKLITQTPDLLLQTHPKLWV